MILKHPLERVSDKVTKVIGEPEEYFKNLQKSYFPTHTDIRIP